MPWNLHHARRRTTPNRMALLAVNSFAVLALMCSVARGDGGSGDEGGQSQGSQTLELAAEIEDKGKQIGTVLGTPIFEADINVNQNAKDNLLRLVLQPLMYSFCKEQGIDRAAELKSRIKDENRREMARFFVVHAELQRHLYQKYGGRVSVSAFGPTAVDGMKEWIKAHEKAGDFEITDTKLRSQWNELLSPDREGTVFASPEQIKAAFDPAITERFIQQYEKVPSGADANFGLVLVGEVLGNPIHIPQRYINDNDAIGEILYTLFVEPFEKREGLGEFQIPAPGLREKFYQRWTTLPFTSASGSPSMPAPGKSNTNPRRP